MATAPRPGVSTRAAQRREQAKVVTITLNGESKTLTPGNIPIRDSAAVRKATGGLPVRMFLPGDEDLVDLDSIKVMWWLARRASGEPDLTIAALEAEWPEELDIENDLQVTVDDGEDVIDQAGDDEATDPQS